MCKSSRDRDLFQIHSLDFISLPPSGFYLAVSQGESDGFMNAAEIQCVVTVSIDAINNIGTAAGAQPDIKIVTLTAVEIVSTYTRVKNIVAAFTLEIVKFCDSATPLPRPSSTITPVPLPP